MGETIKAAAPGHTQCACARAGTPVSRETPAVPRRGSCATPSRTGDAIFRPANRDPRRWRRSCRMFRRSGGSYGQEAGICRTVSTASSAAFTAQPALDAAFGLPHLPLDPCSRIAGRARSPLRWSCKICSATHASFVHWDSPMTDCSPINPWSSIGSTLTQIGRGPRS